MRAVSATLAASVALAASACSFDQSGLAPGAGDDARAADALVGDGPGLPADAEPIAPQPHLLLTEVLSSTPEFIEILNPGAEPVALDHYYLSDDDDSAILPALFGGSTPAPTVSQFDFIVRFPQGAVAAPGQVVVVAINELDFIASFGTVPDYALSASTVPAMNAILAGSSPTLSDSGEGIALLYWDGLTDLVSDVDLVVAGNEPTNSNRLAAKTGLAVDGPDADDAASTYLDDASTIAGTTTDAPDGQAYQRFLPEDGFETDSGGNGVTGHDETSEDMTATWTTSSFANPSPGQVPPALRP